MVIISFMTDSNGGSKHYKLFLTTRFTVMCSKKWGYSEQHIYICHIFPVGRIFSWQDVVCFEHWEDGIELIQEITFTPGGLQVSQSSLNQTSVIKATILDYCTALFISTSIYYLSLCVTVCISAHQGCINLTS